MNVQRSPSAPPSRAGKGAGGLGHRAAFSPLYPLHRPLPAARRGETIAFLSLACLALAAPCCALAAQKDEDKRVRIQPIRWPADDRLSPRGAEVLKEERRFFAEELRHLKEWIPDNMRGAVSKTWTRAGKTMLSESKAIEHVPVMPTEQVEKILAELEDGARNTVADNYERFKAALAKRVPVFAQALEHFKAGEFSKAYEKTALLTKENVLHAFFKYQYDTMPPYVYCTVTFFEGEAYSLDGSLHDAMVRYLIVSKGKLPWSLTFSATARMRAADMYERTSREHFAIELYRRLSEKYADVLCDTEVLGLHVRARKMMREDPFQRAVAAACDTRRLLDTGRTGPLVQETQAELLKLMNSVVNDQEGDGRAHMQINWEMMASEDQFKGGGLQEGAAPTKFNFETDVQLAGSDDWGKLRPREKQEVVQRFLQSCPDEYRTMLEAYFRNRSRAQK